MRRGVDVGPHRDVRGRVRRLHHRRRRGLAHALDGDRLLAAGGVGAGVDGATSAGPGVDRAVVAGAATAMVSSRTSPHSGVSMLRNTLACDACRTTSSRVTSPAGPLGATPTAPPRDRARACGSGGFAMIADGCRDPLRCAAPRALRRRDCTCPPVPYPTSTAPSPSAGSAGSPCSDCPTVGRGCGIRRRGDGDDRRTDVHRVALGGEQLAHGARERRGQLDQRLRGLDLDEHVVDRDAVARADPPLDDLGLGEAFADIGEDERLGAHGMSFRRTRSSSEPARRNARDVPAGPRRFVSIVPRSLNDRLPLSRRGTGRRPRGSGRRRAGRRLRAWQGGTGRRTPTRAAREPRARRTRAPSRSPPPRSRAT